MKIKRIELTAFLLLAVLMMYCAGISLYQRQLAEEVVRLRVIAAGNDMVSQSQKLNVRDTILSFCSSFPAELQDADSAKAFLADHMPELQNRIGSIVGNQPFCVMLTEARYPSRTYRNFSLPAGRYVGMQVHIGAAQGKNWWCVLYPALCTDMTCDDRYDSTTVSFKCAEWISALCSKLWE